MKTKESIQASYDARQNQALKHIDDLYEFLLRIKVDQSTHPVVFHSVRKKLDSLNQCIHEMNAYYNTLETD